LNIQVRATFLRWWDEKDDELSPGDLLGDIFLKLRLEKFISFLGLGF
jgi:hypothetical protein